MTINAIPIMEMGGVAVSDEVTINWEIELIRNQNWPFRATHLNCR